MIPGCVLLIEVMVLNTECGRDLNPNTLEDKHVSGTENTALCFLNLNICVTCEKGDKQIGFLLPGIRKKSSLAATF